MYDPVGLSIAPEDLLLYGVEGAIPDNEYGGGRPIITPLAPILSEEQQHVFSTIVPPNWDQLILE
jgi:hypothetical protein